MADAQGVAALPDKLFGDAIGGRVDARNWFAHGRDPDRARAGIDIAAFAGDTDGDRCGRFVGRGINA